MSRTPGLEARMKLVLKLSSQPPVSHSPEFVALWETSDHKVVKDLGKDILGTLPLGKRSLGTGV